MQENKWVFFLNIVYNGATTTTINYTVQTGAVKESKSKRNKCVSETHKATLDYSSKLQTWSQTCVNYIPLF